MKRAALVLAFAAAALALGAGAAQATNECRGLQLCVRVPGPWVVTPGRADFQLSCPRGFVVGGLDAQLSDRAIELNFLGRLGSPVGPGVTTTRSALFRARYLRRSFPPTFRPLLGCIPAAGGGGGPVPYRIDATFPPVDVTVRRVRDVRLRAGTVRAVAACAAGERFVSGWHAVGFYGARPPSDALVQSVSATRTPRRGRVEVRVRSTPAVLGVRAIVQVGAVCAGGAR